MAHEDTYWEEENNAKTVSDWQERYPATRYMYGVLRKTTTTDYYQESTGDNWRGTRVYHWSYWAPLDWAYPTATHWYSPPQNLSGTIHRSLGNGSIEGDMSQPLREKFLSYGGDSNTTEVNCDVPYAVRDGSTYTFFQTYNYDPSELSPAYNEVAKQDTYVWSVYVETAQGDLWSFNSQEKLTLPQIHSEVLPNTETPKPTEWRLDESGKLTMPVLREVVNDLGAFNKCQKLTDVIIPESVKSIGKKSFRETNLKSAEIASDCTYYETSFPSDCRIYFYGGGTITINSIADMESHQIGRLVTMTINELEGN